MPDHTTLRVDLDGIRRDTAQAMTVAPAAGYPRRAVTLPLIDRLVDHTEVLMEAIGGEMAKDPVLAGQARDMESMILGGPGASPADAYFHARALSRFVGSLATAYAKSSESRSE
jgi:hypothetical protein